MEKKVLYKPFKSKAKNKKYSVYVKGNKKEHKDYSLLDTIKYFD